MRLRSGVGSVEQAQLHARLGKVACVPRGQCARAECIHQQVYPHAALCRVDQVLLQLQAHRILEQDERFQQNLVLRGGDHLVDACEVVLAIFQQAHAMTLAPAERGLPAHGAILANNGR